MTNITVNNSLCRIESITTEVRRALETELKYVNQNAMFSFQKNEREIARLQDVIADPRMGTNMEAQKRLRQLQYQNKALYPKLFKSFFVDNSFPTGLLPRVLKLLDYHKSQFVINDLRVAPKRGSTKYVLKQSFPQLRYYQKAASRIAMENGRGIIVAPTGTGKTLTVSRMIWELGVKTLVITPSKAITDNMVDTLTHHFGKGQVGKLTTKSVKTKNINVINIQALVKLKPSVLKEIDALIIDEFHHAAAETYQEINFQHLAHCYFRIGVTATNFRNDGADIALEAVLSEVLYEYSIEQAIKDGFLVKPSFNIQENYNPVDGSYQTQYKEGIVENEDRNLHISEIAEFHKNDSVIILVQQVEHGEALKKLIPGAEFLHGTEKDDVRRNTMEAFRKGKVKCLIGTSVIGEGVDLPIARILILAGGGKARSGVMQNVGRILRPYPGKEEAVVYDFTDEGSKHLAKHSEMRQEIYQIYAV